MTLTLDLATHVCSPGDHLPGSPRARSRRASKTQRTRVAARLWLPPKLPRANFPSPRPGPYSPTWGVRGRSSRGRHGQGPRGSLILPGAGPLGLAPRAGGELRSQSVQPAPRRRGLGAGSPRVCPASHSPSSYTPRPQAVFSPPTKKKKKKEGGKASASEPRCPILGSEGQRECLAGLSASEAPSEMSESGWLTPCELFLSNLAVNSGFSVLWEQSVHASPRGDRRGRGGGGAKEKASGSGERQGLRKLISWTERKREKGRSPGLHPQ